MCRDKREQVESASLKIARSKTGTMACNMKYSNFNEQISNKLPSYQHMILYWVPERCINRPYGYNVTEQKVLPLMDASSSYYKLHQQSCNKCIQFSTRAQGLLRVFHVLHVFTLK